MITGGEGFTDGTRCRPECTFPDLSPMCDQLFCGGEAAERREVFDGPNDVPRRAAAQRSRRVHEKITDVAYAGRLQRLTVSVAER